MTTHHLNTKLARIARTLSVAALALLSSLPVMAYDTEDKALVEQQLATMYDSMDNKDFATVIDMMPPKILEQFAISTGIPSATIRTALIKSSAKTMEQFETEDSSISHAADLSRAKAFKSSAGRDYLVIPTTVNAVMDNVGVDMTGTLLALEDKDKWYMLRIEDQSHLDILNKAYPDMKDIEMFESTQRIFDVEDK